jgi:hypothetical protein
MTIADTPHPDPGFLRRLAGLEPGWHTALDCAFQLPGGDAYEGRSATLADLGNAYKYGELERIHVWQKDRPLPTYFIDPTALLARAEELEL